MKDASSLRASSSSAKNDEASILQSVKADAEGSVSLPSKEESANRSEPKNSTLAAPKDGNSFVQASTSFGKDVQALQEIIEELTREKFLLERGLQSQRKILDRLVDENESLAQALNARTSQAEAWIEKERESEQEKKRSESAELRSRRLAEEVISLEDDLERISKSYKELQRIHEGTERTAVSLQMERRSLLARLKDLATRRGDERTLWEVEGWSRGAWKEASTQTTSSESTRIVDVHPKSTRRRERLVTSSMVDLDLIEEDHLEILENIHEIISDLKERSGGRIEDSYLSPGPLRRIHSDEQESDSSECSSLEESRGILRRMIGR